MNDVAKIDSTDAAQHIRNLARWTLEPFELFRSEAALRQARLLVLDSIGCAYAALPASSPRRVFALIDELGGNPECTVIGKAGRTSVLNAVLANGALVRSLDFNDVQFFMKEGKLSVAGHCSDNIPAALAIGERTGATPEAVLVAIVMGYELFKRLRELMPFVSAWDGTTVSGMVSAAMTGRLMGLDAEKQAHALALAAARSATPSVVRWGKLSGAKNLANALISQSGVLAALLAAKGVTGPLELLEHRGGMHQVFDPSLGLDNLWKPPSEPLYILTSNIKPYACIGTAQATVAAALDLHGKLAGRAAEIERIEVVMADLPMIRKQQGEMERRYPKTREAADHSFTFLPIVAMLDGEFSDRQFDNRRWEEPGIVELIGRTELLVDEGLGRKAPDSMPSAVRVTLKSGEVLESECLYHPGCSIGARGVGRDAVVEKFLTITAPFIDRARADRLIAELLDAPAFDLPAFMQRLGAAG